MFIPQSEIRAANVQSGLRYAGTALQSVREAKAAKVETAFLCHSHKDRDLAERVQSYLLARGIVVYIDWQDATMPEVPSVQTAERIKQRIREDDFLIFLATENSIASRWCPWEIGYSDGVKGPHSVVILPTSNPRGNFGSEYLQLYRRIGSGFGTQLKFFSVGA